ncbi:hypothetical protein EG329_010592 [Mollisiaceae sp. DMI_Dod_QoI]|nr:hypothetical protein EG329_010592 [Helotiales sp. DMI_Dod_QoI]
MSFGFSVGDFIAVGQLAWTVYKGCKEAPESFANISAEVLSLHAVLKEVEEVLSDQPPSATRQNSLAAITQGCQDVLRDLQALTKKYESLGSKSKMTWDRMRWGANDIAGLRQRLTSNILLLNSFISVSQVVVGRKLENFIQEFRDGKREGSIISVASIESLTLDDKQMWRAIRKELENIGISVAAFDANKGFILQWFQEAVETGAFEEQERDNDSNSSSTENGSFLSSLSHGEVIDAGYNTWQEQEPQSLDVVIEQAPPAPQEVKKSQATMSRRIPILASDTPGDVPSFDVEEAKVKPPQKPKNISSMSSPDVRSNSKNNTYSLHRPIPSPKRRIPRVVTFMARILNLNASFLKACDMRDINAASKLLNRGAEVDAKSDNEDTALIRMSRRGLYSMVKFLLDNGAEVNALGRMWGTALHGAVDAVNPRLVELLCDRGADINAQGPEGTALHSAISGKDLEIVKLLCDRGADINAQGPEGTALYTAISKGNREIVKLLCDRGADINAKGPQGTALHAAISALDRAIVELLCDYGADMDIIFGVHTPVENALYQAINLNRPAKYHSASLDIAKVLFDKGARINEANLLLSLHRAIQNRNLETIRFLLDHGADVDTRSLTSTPLIEAAKLPPHHYYYSNSLASFEQANMKSTIVNMLLEKGADVERKDVDGYTALDHVVRGKDFKTADLLVEKGAMNNSSTLRLNPFQLGIGQLGGDTERLQWLYHDICEGYRNYEEYMSLRQDPAKE